MCQQALQDLGLVTPKCSAAITKVIYCFGRSKEDLFSCFPPLLLYGWISADPSYSDFLSHFRSPTLSNSLHSQFQHHHVWSRISLSQSELQWYLRKQHQRTVNLCLSNLLLCNPPPPHHHPMSREIQLKVSINHLPALLHHHQHLDSGGSYPISYLHVGLRLMKMLGC